MLEINVLKVELKYKLGYTKESPTKYDLLYEIAEFLQMENKEEFNEWELKNKTKSRLGTLEENLQVLIEETKRGDITDVELAQKFWDTFIEPKGYTSKI